MNNIIRYPIIIKSYGRQPELLRCLLVVLILVWSGSISRPLLANVEGVVLFAAESEPAEEEAEADEEEEEKAAENPNERVFGPEVFDQWMFQGGNEQAGRKTIDSKLELQTNDIHLACQLTEAQRKKLELVGRHQAKLLFDQIAELRLRFEHSKRTQQDINRFWQEIQPLRNALMGGRLADSSIFDKVVRKTLTPEQLPKYLQVAQARQKFRQQAQLELILLNLDKQLPLRADQRDKLLALLQELPPVRSGQYELMALQYLASQQPEEKYKAILDDVQWKVMQQQFARARGMGQWLKQNGALTDDASE